MTWTGRTASGDGVKRLHVKQLGGRQCALRAGVKGPAVSWGFLGILNTNEIQFLSLEADMLVTELRRITMNDT